MPDHPTAPPTHADTPPRYHYVYILVSNENPSHRYVGYTTDIQARITKHNQGGVPHTAEHRPSQVETAIRFR